MGGILLNPNNLRQLTSRFLDSVAKLRQFAAHLGGRVGSLNRSVRHKVNPDEQIAEWNSRANDMMGRMETQAHNLGTKAQAFEDEDRQAAAAIPGAPPRLDLAAIGKDAPDASQAGAVAAAPAGKPEHAAAASQNGHGQASQASGG